MHSYVHINLDCLFKNYTSPAGVLDPHSYKFYELFDLDKDPWQLKNIYSDAASDVKKDLHAIVAAEFKCSGETCQ